MTDLGVDLGWGARPRSASVIPPLWEVGQREGNFLRCARSTSLGSCRSSRRDYGGLVGGVIGKVVVSHGVRLCCVLLKEILEEGRGEKSVQNGG